MFHATYVAYKVLIMRDVFGNDEDIDLDPGNLGIIAESDGRPARKGKSEERFREAGSDMLSGRIDHLPDFIGPGRKRLTGKK